MSRTVSLAALVLFLLTTNIANAQTTYFPAKGVWNGFLSQLNILECDNGNSVAVDLGLKITASSGQELATTGVRVPAFGSTHTILNDVTNVFDNVGVFTISLGSGQDSLGDKLNCRTVFYRSAAPGSPKLFDYAYSLPVQNPQSGELAGIYNSIDPSAGPNLTYNWLSIINFDSTPFSATVLVYNGDGSIARAVEVKDLPPGGRQDIALGHPDGQTTGLYRVDPVNNAALYDAWLIRYNIAPDGKFNYAFPLRGTGGSCTGQPVLASTMGNGLTKNWLEIANTGEFPILVNVEVRDRDGVLVHSERPEVRAKSQYHVFLSNKIDPLGLGNVGSARVICDDPTDRLIIQSTFYGAIPGSFPVEWAYSTQELGRVPVGSNATVSAPINTFVGMSNWFKFADATLTSSGVEAIDASDVGALNASLLQFTAFNQAGQAAAQGELTLPAGGTADLGVHALVPADSVGSVSVASSTAGAAYSGEMLRVLTRIDGQIGNIISIPGIVSQNGIDNGSFKGNPQSLAKYRNKLSMLEANRLLAITSFGGSPAEVDRVMRDGLEASVARLTSITGDSPALKRESADWLDNQLGNLDTQGDPNHTGVKRWWLTYILKSPNGIRERLALFWHDRFASSCRVLGNGREMNRCIDQMQIFRNNALGNFRDIVKATTVDYLMLVWLNGNLNVASHPDENHAREIMELFTLGERQRYGRGLRYPLYTEGGDIPEFARAMTGYTTSFVNDQFGQDYVVSFVLNRHDSGVKTVFKDTPYEVRGKFQPLDVPDVILNNRPRDVGRYLSGALFSFLCHDHPDEQLKAQMADILIASNWEVRPLVRRILTSEACYSQEAYRSRMLDPLTFAIGFLKRTSIPMRVDRLQDSLARMGFDITNPVDVFGWDVGFREKQHGLTTFWTAFPVEYANFVTLALRSHEWDFRDPDTNTPLFDYCSLNPRDDARGEDVVDHLARMMAFSLSASERREYVRYIDNEIATIAQNGEITERPDLYDGRVPEDCRRKATGVLWLIATNPRNLTY